ncbi:MAG: homoserine dehydrogenase [Lachnospiraceae bacterium]|nr:homoserine dehydrogenase [Cuneatibacter sp.]MDD6455447.1 homoserine dehydrogenase [Lachnospiraceae bacterium]
MIQTAILGYGNIGSGVAQVLTENRDIIAEKAGEEVALKYILDLRDFPEDPLGEKVVHDVQVILNDPEVQIVVETMGGTKPAYAFVKAALEAGKHVATSNKELVAAHGTELLQIAAEHQVNFLFEASVGGAIPIIRPLNVCTTADRIKRISGILNGTTNFMLTNMSKEGRSFDSVLKEAQELGYAERHPEADVEGWDACRKIAILCSMAYGQPVSYEDVHTEGITKITEADVEYAKALGRSIKLIASGQMTEDGLEISVSPVMIAADHPLASVNGVINAVLVEGAMSGPLMFYGAGAGKLPTASAVAADVVEAARNLNRTVLAGWSGEKAQVKDWKESSGRFYVRLSGNYMTRKDKLKDIAIRNIIEDVRASEFAILTEEMKEGTFYSALEKLPGVLGICRIQ